MFTSLGIIKLGFHRRTFWIGWHGEAQALSVHSGKYHLKTSFPANSVSSRSQGDQFGIWRVNLAVWPQTVIFWLIIGVPSGLCRSNKHPASLNLFSLMYFIGKNPMHGLNVHQALFEVHIFHELHPLHKYVFGDGHSWVFESHRQHYMASLMSSDVRKVEDFNIQNTRHVDGNKKGPGLNRRLLRLLSVSGTVRLRLVAVEFRLCHSYALPGSHPGEHSLDWPGWRLAQYTGSGWGSSCWRGRFQ